MWIEFFLFLALLFIFLVLRDKKPKGMPPGPSEIPFLGNSPVFEEKAAMSLQRQYGDCVTVRLGEVRTVLLFDAAVGKEVLGRQETTGRPEYFRTFGVDDLKMGGVIGGEGAQWQHDRRFVLRNLRNLGMGKSYLEDAINFEAEALVEDLKKYNEEPIKFPDSFKTAPLNIIWQMVASTRYDLRSTEVEKIYRISKEANNQSYFSFLPIFFPSLTKMCPKFILDKVFNQDVFDKFFEETRVMVEKSLKKHEDDSDLENPIDLIDEYLKGINDQNGDGSKKLFRRGALVQIISDLFAAGSDTVYNMLKWVCYLLAKYPTVAAKLQQTIDQHVARSRLVSLSDKPNLLYVEAFVNEALRYSTLIPMNVEHQALQDTTVQGYTVPKGTLLIVCTYACHFDQRYWTDPEQFRPERFLNAQGNFEAPRIGFFAFSQGRRQCLGETLARMELFLFTAAIAQNFDITAPEGVDLASLEPVNRMGLRVPEDTSLRYRVRK